MSRPDDPVDLSAAAKRTAALLREARSVQRRLDKLAVQAADEDALTQRQVAEARTAAEHLVGHLERQERTQTRRVHEAQRRPRR